MSQASLELGYWIVGMGLVASEFAIGGVYFSPLLVASILGVSATWLVATLLNRFRLTRFFFYPPLVFLALAVLFTGVIGTFVVPV